MNPIKRISWFLFCVSLVLILSEGMVNATGGCGTVPSSVSALTLYCIPANIVNTQSVATNSGLQVMIPFNSLAYQPYLSNSLQNIYVYNSISGKQMPTWVEGDASNETAANLISSDVIIWVNLMSNTIGSSASANGIYEIGVGATTTNFYTSGNDIGLAPQLGKNIFGSYGKYDNGNVVFPTLYSNFSGSSLPSSFTSSSSTFTVNDGLTISSSGEGNIGVYTQATYLPTNILDWYGTPFTITGNAFQGTTNNGGIGWGLAQSQYPNDPEISDYGMTTQPRASLSYFQVCALSTSDCVNAFTSPPNKGVYSTWLNPSNVLVTRNYTGLQYASSGGGSSLAENIGWGEGYSSSTVTITVTWVRLRVAPPNDVMPKVTYGSIQPSESASLAFGSNPTTYPTGTTITATCVPSTDTCEVVSGTSSYFKGVLCSGTGTCTNTIPTGYLAAGTYTPFWSNDITLSTNSLPVTYTVSQNASTLITLPSFPNPNSVTYSNTKYTITANIISFNNQLTANAWNNGALVTIFTTQTPWQVGASAGTYVEVANTLGNGNYIAASVTNTLVINQATPDGSLTLNGLSTSFSQFADTPIPVNGMAVSVIANQLTWNIDYIAPNGMEYTFATFSNSISQTFQSDTSGTFNWWLTTSGNTNYTSYTTANIYLTQNGISFFYQYANTIWGNNNNFTILASPLDALSIQINGSIVITGNSTLVYNLANYLPTGTNIPVNAVDHTTGQTITNTISIYNPIIYACEGYSTLPAVYNSLVTENGILNQTIKQINILAQNGSAVPANTISSNTMSGYITYNINNYKSQDLIVTSNGTISGLASNTFWQSNYLQLCEINPSINSNPALLNGTFQFTNAHGVTTFFSFVAELLSHSPLTINNIWTPVTPPFGIFNIYVLQNGLNQIAARVEIFMFNPNTNTYTLLDYINTPAINGQLVQLPNNQSYTFNIYSSSGQLLAILSKIPVYCSTGSICNLPLPTTQTYNGSALTYLSADCVYNQASLKETCSVNDGSNSASSWNLQMYLNGAASNTQVCNTTVDTYFGTLSCTSINASKYDYSYYVYAKYLGATYLVAQGQLGQNAFSNTFGTTGYIAALLIMIILSFIGIYNPIFTIIADVLGIVAIALLGFTALNTALITYLIIMSVLMLYKLRLPIF